MARPKNTESVVDDAVMNNAKTTTDETIQNKVNEEDKKTTEKSVNQEPLKDTDEIEVVSLIPNVSYKDSKTLDMYEWDEVGHTEHMTFETLKNMWRSHKGYFKNMWLKPNDDRVIKKFGLTKTFEKYEFLMNASNYTEKKIDAICDAISDTPNGLKFAICDRVKSLVIDKKVTDASVIKTLEGRLKIDLMKFL